MLIVSACLLGIDCKYNGGNNRMPQVLKYLEGKQVIPVCPEQLGGFSTPRAPTEIRQGSGSDVLDGKAGVFRKNGEDVTDGFLKGAQEVLKIARCCDAGEALMKANSPSCGCGSVYDGSFTGKLVPGNGVTSELLKRNGIFVMTEKDIQSKTPDE